MDIPYYLLAITLVVASLFLNVALLSLVILIVFTLSVICPMSLD